MTAGRRFHTVTEQRDRAGMVLMICVTVQRRMELRADSKQTQRQNQQRTKASGPAKSRRRRDAMIGGDGQHG